MENEREQIIHNLIVCSLNGTQQQFALQLMEQCLEWPDYCDLLLNELQQTEMKAEEEMICVYLKQAIMKQKPIRHQETIEIILSKIERIKKTGILVITHLFLVTTEEIQRMIFEWILRNIRLTSAIELLQSIITDTYTAIQDIFEEEIAMIIEAIIPLLLEENPMNVTSIILTLKEISYSPPSQFLRTHHGLFHCY